MVTNKLVAVAAMLGLCISPSAALAGGVVPQGMGMYDDGRTVETVPANSSLLRWTYYGSVLDAQMKDEIMRAIASVDYETLDFRLLYGEPPAAPFPAGYTQIWVSGKSDPVFPECTDATPGGCTFASTQCLAQVKDGAFNFCSQYRVNLYVNNIVYRAAHPQPGQQVEDPYDKAFGVIRHEIGHILGLHHEYPGPMTNDNDAPFHMCELLMWSLFNVDPAISVWTYPPLPAACQ